MENIKKVKVSSIDQTTNSNVTVETITNSQARKVQIIRSPGSVGLASNIRPVEFFEQPHQFLVDPNPLEL